MRIRTASDDCTSLRPGNETSLINHPELTFSNFVSLGMAHKISVACLFCLQAFLYNLQLQQLYIRV